MIFLICKRRKGNKRNINTTGADIGDDKIKQQGIGLNKGGIGDKKIDNVSAAAAAVLASMQGQGNDLQTPRLELAKMAREAFLNTMTTYQERIEKRQLEDSYLAYSTSQMTQVHAIIEAYPDLYYKPKGSVVANGFNWAYINGQEPNKDVQLNYFNAQKGIPNAGLGGTSIGSGAEKVSGVAGATGLSKPSDKKAFAEAAAAAASAELERQVNKQKYELESLNTMISNLPFPPPPVVIRRTQKEQEVEASIQKMALEYLKKENDMMKERMTKYFPEPDPEEIAAILAAEAAAAAEEEEKKIGKGGKKDSALQQQKNIVKKQPLVKPNIININPNSSHGSSNDQESFDIEQITAKQAPKVKNLREIMGSKGFMQVDGYTEEEQLLFQRLMLPSVYNEIAEAEDEQPIEQEIKDIQTRIQEFVKNSQEQDDQRQENQVKEREKLFNYFVRDRVMAFLQIRKQKKEIEEKAAAELAAAQAQNASAEEAK
ncbi:MAG: hypothetical protein EZS28_039526 [Streblomastix strix]|uniref:Uncharacterized protein n=1 Tax=Streblomastix strix TaxID=222440 RepID=A0A5J4U2Y9_9EUKA|nr:MAG: hypothetical protein EZS28_039526 [Streblomastix strix]